MWNHALLFFLICLIIAFNLHLFLTTFQSSDGKDANNHEKKNALGRELDIWKLSRFYSSGGLLNVYLSQDAYI